jgi:transcriptional regulator with XRE-family HTH domain
VPPQGQQRVDAFALGHLLRASRQAAGLTQAVLAKEAQISERHVRRLERGQRRTRRSTLGRLAYAIVNSEPAVGPATRLVEELVVAAGSALADESDHADRVDRRRARRARRALMNDHTWESKVTIEVLTGVVERCARDVPAGTAGRRRSVFYIFRAADGRRRRLPATPVVEALFVVVPLPWEHPSGNATCSGTGTRSHASVGDHAMLSVGECASHTGTAADDW